MDGNFLLFNSAFQGIFVNRKLPHNFILASVFFIALYFASRFSLVLFLLVRMRGT